MTVRPRLARGTPRWLAALWLAPLLARGAPARVAALAFAAAPLWFFRDPERAADGPGVLAAADGRVREVSRCPDGRWLVSTYLSLRDVHVTRAPCHGVVRSQVHRSGSHRPAAGPSAHGNECVEWRFDTAYGELALTQYAGLLARRIVTYVAVGDTVRRGQRIGLIRFGSRVDVALAHGMAPAITRAARPRGGATVLAGEVDVA